MKALLAAFVGLVLCTLPGRAEEANGLRVTVQKTILERDKERDASAYWDKVQKALGLKVNLRNITLRDFPEGTVDFVVIVKRWGYTPERLESYSGSEKLAALAKGNEANLIVGKIPLGGYESGGNRKQYSDSIEGWRIVVKHGDVETIKMTSTAAFDKMLPKAKPGAEVK